MPKTVVVAMSGGVDSSVVAAMMNEQGHKVIGITLQLYDHGAVLQKKGACCAGQDIYDAKMVADRIGIPHYVLNYENLFRQKVIDDFVDSYARGETPLPCVRCNQSVKFKDLLKFAKELGGDVLATGHYVQKIINHNTSELHRGLDPYKDQSYFLFSTTEIVTRMRPSTQKLGKFVHIDGFEVGEHKGIINYTVGQRRGLGISYGKPIYVIKIDPETNTVYIGPESALFKTKFIIKEVNWLAGNVDTNDIDIVAKVRSTTSGIKAKIDFITNDKIEVTALGVEKAITPGQACVLYDNTRVLGGGWITRDIQ